jgi:hypothetical protein
MEMATPTEGFVAVEYRAVARCSLASVA